MTRRLAALGLLAAACAALLSLPASGANFASRSTNSASVTTDATANYLRLFSRRGRPDARPARRTRASATPARAVKAATGATARLAVALGGYKNTNNTSDPARVPGPGARPLPAGVSVDHVTATLLPDASGKQPLTGYTFTNLLGPQRDVVGHARPRRQALGQPLGVHEGQRVPGQQPPVSRRPCASRSATRATPATFLSYDVPVTIWDGNGSGP